MFPTRPFRVVLAATMALYAPISAQGQVPGTPVLQNAFVSPGLAIAANFGSSSGQSYFGAAGGWGLGGGRLQLSGGAGVQRVNNTSRGAYGVRLASGLWSGMGGALGAGAFVGLGGAARTRANNAVTNPAIMSVPIGASIGYQHSLGATRAFSVYGSPMYRWSRVTTENGAGGSVTTSSSGFRASVGADVSISQSFGATVGAEFGGSSGGVKNGSVLGVALTFAPGRR